jgi:nicotinamidase-related amidase
VRFRPVYVSVMDKEDVDYGRSALIVWDMQNGIARNTINFDQQLRNVRILIDISHTNSVPVIYSQHTGTEKFCERLYLVGDTIRASSRLR